MQAVPEGAWSHGSGLKTRAPQPESARPASPGSEAASTYPEAAALAWQRRPHDS
jgi:hypothetical protein